MRPPRTTRVVIACGGTGGHLFPGLAVAEQLVRRGSAVTLLISPKDVDQQAVRHASGMNVLTLPAIGLQNRNYFSFARSFWKSYRAAKNHFSTNPPQAALAMGGFTSAPPILAARRFGAKTFLHESNTIPGRANRWLSWVVDRAFVGFPQARERLHIRDVTVTGTPVRPQFKLQDAAMCRKAVGLDSEQPALLVMGGSQGASGINELVIRTLPLLKKQLPQLQLFHLAGPNDSETIRRKCADIGVKALVHSFFAEMELALGAATVCVSRAGASSLAELAAMRVPCVLIPFPAATDNHQFYNGCAFAQSGAARLLEQAEARPEILAEQIVELIEDSFVRDKMQAALAQWDYPEAAREIAEVILSVSSRNVEAAGSVHVGGAQNESRSKPAERQSFSAA